MSRAPIGQQKLVPTQTEPSTMDRLLARSCTRDEFFLLYSKLLQERMPDHTVQFVDESTLRIEDREGGQSSTHLDNLWLKYKENKEDRSELIDRYVRMSRALGEPQSLPDRHNIVAMVKDCRYIETVDAKKDLATEHLCGDLWIVYAEDRPETIVTLKSEDIVALGIIRTDLLALAVDNLNRIIPQVECQGEGPWYTLTSGVGYDASLLLLDEVWDQVAEMVNGDVVASAPARDTLMFTGSGCADGLVAIREKSAEICNNSPHAVSESLLLRRDGKWSVFNAN